MDKNNKKKALYLKTIGFIKPFKWLLMLSIALSLCFSFMNTISVALIKPVFQIVFEVEQPIIPAENMNFLESMKEKLFSIISDIIQSDDIYSTLLRFGFIIVVVFVLKNLFKYLGAIVMAKFEEGIIKSIRDKVFSKMTSLSIEFFNKSKQGSLVSIIANDVAIVNQTMISSFSIILREGSQVIFFLLFLFSISTELTLIAFSSSLLSLTIVRLARKFLRRYATRMQKALADYTGTLTEIIAGIRIVKAYNAENFANNKFKKDSEKYVLSAVKHKKIVTLLPAINEIFAIAALTIVLLVGAMKIEDKVLSPDDLMLFLFSLFSIMVPIASVINQFVQFPRGFVSADRIFEILDKERTVSEGEEELASFDNSIEVKNITFAYDEKTILRNVSFKIEKGKKIAFVGPSGCGKSTMLDLLIRFYDPISGSIEIDGKDIKNFTIKSYRNTYGIVSQENILFNDTVANNINYGNDTASSEEIIIAAKLANALNFIERLENGFETMLGDRGVNLSGGERQRLAIARALLRNPEILVFDEATSALDAKSEQIVQMAIEEALEGKTAIIVAHRLSTIMNCDKIFVFEQGSIAESGTHQELIQKDGLYRKLFEMQYGSIS